MRTTIEDQKRVLLDGLTAARSELLKAVRELPVDCADVVFLGVWSIKDLLAHLIGWDETNFQAVQAILSGRVPGFFDAYDKDWQSYNRGLVEKYRKDSLGELLADVEEAQQRLLAYLTLLPASDVVNGKVARPGGRTVTIRNLLRAEARDEAVHLEQVKQYFTREM